MMPNVPRFPELLALMAVILLASSEASKDELTISLSGTTGVCKLTEQHTQLHTNDAQQELKLEAKKLGFVKNSVDKHHSLTVPPGTMELVVEIPGLIQGEVYNFICSLLTRRKKIKESTYIGSITGTIPGLVYSVSKVTLSRVEISFKNPNNLPLTLYYRSLQRGGSCILASSPVKTVNHLTLTQSPVIVDTRRMQFWISAGSDGLTPPVLVGSVKNSVGHSEISTQRVGDSLTIKHHGTVDESSDLVGVYHDLCGHCQAVLLPSCEDSLFRKFRKLDSVAKLCENEAPTHCAVSEIININVEQKITTASTIGVRLTEPDGFDSVSPTLEIWFDKSLRIGGKVSWDTTKFKPSKQTSNEIVIPIQRTGNSRLNLHYTSLKQTDGQCIPHNGIISAAVSESLTTSSKIISTEDRIQYWITSEKMAHTPRITAGTTKVKLGANNHIVSAQRLDNILELTTEKQLKETDEIVGVFHDECGSCEGVLMSDCSQVSVSMFVQLNNLKEICSKGVQEKCVVGTHFGSPEDNSQTVHVKIAKKLPFDTTAYILTVWAEPSLLYSGAPQIELKVYVETDRPRITWSTDANLGIDAFQVTVWNKPDSEKIISVGSVTTLELTGLESCTEYTVQVMAVKEGLPLLEISSAPVSFTILGEVYTPVVTVENTAPDVVHVSWTKPTSCQSSDYIYKLSVNHAGSEPMTITKMFPTTDHIFRGLMHCTEYTFTLSFQNSKDPSLNGTLDPVTLRTMPENLDSPTHLEVLAVNPLNLTVSWIENKFWDVCGTIQHVVTVVPLSGDPLTIVKVDGTSATVPVNECNWYEVYVHVETADSELRSARSKGIVVQSPLRPYGVPDFELENLNPGIQKISWSTGAEWSGECVRKYDVTINPIESPKDAIRFIMLSGTPGKIIGELKQCTEYQYTVSSGSEVKTKILKSLPSSFLPADVMAEMISPNAIKVNWSAPPCSESIVHYSVVVKPLDEGLETIKQEVAKDSLTQEPLEVLVKPCTAYLVYMEADAMGSKDHSELIMVTDKKKPNVTVVNIEPGVQKVSWTDPSTAPECRHLYEVQQNNVDTGEKVTIIVSATERIFVQLAHCTNYEYTVRVVGEYVSGQNSDPVRLVTMAPKPETPTLIDVTVEGPTSVRLSWSTPIPHDHCSHTGYIVTAQAADASLIQTNTDLQYKTLTVESCTSYLVAVQAQYSDGTLSEKSKFRAITSSAHEPGAPVNLRISVNSAHKQVLRWKEPYPGYKCPHMYELERTETGSDGTDVTHIRFYSITHEYVVLSLKPWTTNSYRLRIIGIPGNVVGPYSVATSRTTTKKETLAGMLSDYMTAIDSTESTISLHLNLSSLLGIPDLHIMSLLIQPQHEQSHIRHESTIFAKSVSNLLDKSWNDRIHNGTGAWELKLWERSKHTLLQTARDATIILGQTVPCTDSPYCEPGQLMPGAIYGIQLRIYSPNGIFTSRQIFATTKTDLICLRILLGFVAAVAGFAIILAKFAYTYHTSASWNRLGAESVNVEHKQKPEKVNKRRSWTEHVQRVGRYSIMRDDEDGSNFRRTGYMPTTSVVQTGRTIGELRAYLDECLQPTSMQLDEQFTTLRQDCLKREIDENMTTNFATDPKNHALNRYPDIIPYDHTAVLLSGNNPLKNEIEYYINASHIYAINPCKDAHAAPKLNPARVDYIAAQAPLKKTIADFWEMIAENHVSLIIMLTQLVEDNVPKCARYWPDEVYATTIHMSHGNELAVTLISEEDYPSYIIRKISLVSGSEEAASTTVTQLQMKFWPEHGVPYLADFTAVINEYQKLKLIEENRGAPTLVHCSTGAARSGVFIAADIIKRQLDSGEGLFDIQGTVALLRECRMHMVQKVPNWDAALYGNHNDQTVVGQNVAKAN
ncbi:hypothetical protein CRM22_002557 [Opisthorchis felineus]|uniref:Uncharacterized protein n=1 Tax=Opisthorchis felineus TaxID=147828 RepID=A0A4S2M601_OPIFE|nr:hypothetical protein CRM22_002557 [Opisthorchis felineus]